MPGIKGLLTLGQVARAGGLARASLLHYESRGLLLPTARSPAGYRLYGEAELERLRKIRRFREAGLSLAAIGSLLAFAQSRDDQRPADLLEARLLGLCDELERLRAQQRQLARLLALEEFRTRQVCRSKAAWVALLRRAGFDDQDMLKWHMDFEAENPVEHTAFLRALGLAPAEVAAIRRRSGATSRRKSRRVGAATP